MFFGFFLVYNHPMKKIADWLKFVLGWIICFAIRFIPAPFRPANLEPVMATTMPFSKQYGSLGGFAFGFLSIALFDLAVGRFGGWTIFTAAAYGLVGLFAGFYFKNRPSNSWNYLKFGIAATLAYDALTGLTIGPIFFGQTIASAFFGQIPFTAMHLAGNIFLSFFFSPAIYRFVVINPALAWDRLAGRRAVIHS